jgi:carboxyl-terminal processing protease
MKRSKILFILPVFFAGLCLGAFTPNLSALQEKVYKSLDLFTKVLYLVEKDYVEETDGEELIYGAIKGMLGTLDPYSVFLTPDIYKELKVDTVGRFGGVGLEITLQQGILTVVSPIEDTPAARAGIKPGDRILKINGKSTKEMNLADAVRRMRGSKKSKVTLSLYREGVKKPFDVHLVREVIKIKSVKSELLPSGILYVRITNFQEHTYDELLGVLKETEKKSGTVKGLVLDMRNNPGGLLDEAVSISDLFLKSGVIVSTQGRQGVQEVHRASPEGDFFEMPVVVLLNRGSASASEIVAAALRDNQRAKIIGTKSFGKASVQTVIELGEGTGLKLTVAKYLTPHGKFISGTGIEPDFVVENPEDEVPAFGMDSEKDLQRKAAISYLETGQVPPASAKSAETKEKEEVEEDFHSEEEVE